MTSRRAVFAVVMLCIFVKASVYCQDKQKILGNDDFSTNKPTETALKEDENEPLIMMERTSCFGGCPVYKLTIYPTGVVIYEGKDSVAVKGKKTTVIGIDKVKELKAEINRAKFYSLKDKYEGGPTDSASVKLTITTM